jgi:signal transduction histidine kinase
LGGEPLRRRLFVLAVAAIVPLAATSGIALLVLAQQQEAQAERAGIEITRALSTAVDAELARSISVLEGLAVGPALDAGELRRYHEVMRRALETRPDWVTMTLADPSGRQLLNARASFGRKLGRLVEPASFEQAVRARRAIVGALAKGPGGEYGVPVRVPVVRGGSVRYVLTAAVRPEVILEVLNRQRLPQDWVVSVFDASGSRVARSRQHAQFIDQPPSPSLLELMRRGGSEGSGITHALEGDQIYTAYSRSAETGWTVAIGIPPSVVEAGARRSLAVYGGGLLLSMALGVLAALAVGRRITAPMAWLRNAAQALGRRQTVTPPVTSILEIRDVGNALAAAAEERAGHEAEREELLHREQEARAAAEAASRAKDEFLAMLGHELRNPLGAIANASRLLDQPDRDAEGARLALGVLRRQVDHLSRLTDDLLDAGRAVTGKILLERRPIELAPLVSRALDTLQATGRLGAHDVRRALADGIWVNADPTRMEQVLVNLVGNAVKFTPPGGTIAVSLEPGAEGALLAVSDTGIGMPPELRERAFDLFVQGDNGLERSQGGLGIGLTLVRRIAELHGGHAAAASGGPGQGSRFSVWLPTTTVPARPAAQAAETAPARARDILIVEDNDDAAQTLQRLLEMAGHRVRTARDGAAGLAMLRAEPPEIALIDVGLPRMSGYEVARAARGAADGRRPVLVALTGYGAPEDRERALAAGFDEHLVKPVDFDVLKALLARLS